MKKIALILLALFAMAGPSLAKTKRKSTHAKTTVRRTSHRTSAHSAHSAHSAQPGQPTPERYQEIQRSLAEKGYYKGDVNGQWGPESTSALKRFQSDQNLASDGKLNSLSLIALGLGPKRSLTAQVESRP